uniref:C2H2-type domain-containing protein n=1 Tax=Lotharella oceanica TaxID=641309 RepID=A0A7S2XHZ5_9EUKA|mmetsp:Transcript_36620/g.67668  ORF Transcript_36620/g.67668 Transcript_36620/m.67668 type:complete len:100 (+) Transcript_36620:797-1096(+)
MQALVPPNRAGDKRRLFKPTLVLSPVKKRSKPKKKHVCPYCEREFLQNCNLVAHIRTHTGERPYACELCDKAFKQMSNLKRHRARLHSQIESAPSYNKK